MNMISMSRNRHDLPPKQAAISALIKFFLHDYEKLSSVLWTG